MMVKHWKKGVVLTVAASMMLSACGNGGKKEPSASNSPAAGSGSPAASAPASATPKAKEKITLNWFVPASANTSLPDASKDFVLQAIEQKFNVDLKLTYMATGTDYITKINALLASTPPDMWVDQNGDGGNKYALDGLLADLTNFVSPATMPNYFKNWTTDDEVKRYQIQNGFFRAPLPYMKRTYRIYYIRKDWLDTLGMKIPTTYDEYYNVIKAFTEKDPDGNGKADTFGFSTAGSGANLGYEWPEWANQKLLFPTFIENNSIVDGTMSPKMETVLDQVAKLTADRLVDPDWYLNKSPQHIEKAIQGKVGVVMGTTKDFALDSNAQGLQFRTKQINPKAEWQPFTMVGDTPLSNKLGPSYPFLIAKSVAEKDPEKVRRTVEILDWLAGEEGYMLTHFGQEGKDYTRDGKTITINADNFNNDVVKQGNFLKIWSFFTQETVQPQVFGLSVIDPKETDRDRAIIKFLDEQPANNYIGTSLTPPQGFDLAGFRKRQNELFSKAIFEDKSGKNWPAYREELLSKYKASDLFAKYNEDLKKAGIIK
ncbi:MAG: extracellular solute-binding protein [Paenibacillaceae bacterium]|nr:extracellular solute-binding protein [Paenibacillaceae bacterium]